MKNKVLLLAFCLLTVLSLQAQTNERYIEVTSISEIEIVPEKIHYLIEIREYFEEEFDGKSKPEEYRTKVSLSEIEQELREAFANAGIPQNAIRTRKFDLSSDAASFDNFRTIKKNYSMLVRFEIID